MKERFVSVFWGIVLVFAGALALLGNMHLIQINDPYVGMAVTGGMSLLFFASYFFSGPKRWGWLFPACILAGATLTIALSLVPGFPEGLVAAPVMLGIAAPFLAAYFMDPAARRWALIPFYSLMMLAIIIIFTDILPGEVMGALILLAFALPFLAAYLMNRERKWALIPASILVALSIVPLLTIILDGAYAGVAVLALFTVGFGAVYFLKPRHWWALIPAGLFLTSAVSVLLSDTPLGLRNGTGLAERAVGSVFFIGLALTFLVLWLRRSSIPTTWAVYPAVALGLLAVVTMVGGENGMNTIWPLMIIAGGLLILYRSYRRRLA